jgi:DNA repair exonuclease SbcCD ATPase subunit
MAGKTSEEGNAGGQEIRDLAAVEADFQGKIEDVRERVVQVKREADGKAPADHDHEDLEARIDALEAETDELRADLDDARADIDTGFDNFESILENLTDRADTLGDRTGRLAGAVLDLRRAVEAIAGSGADPVEPLAEAANRNGVREADCEECSNAVDIALLRSPACPHCGVAFSDVRPAKGWFGSATLVAGDPPALEPAADDGIAGHDIEDMVEEDT